MAQDNQSANHVTFLLLLHT